MRLAILVCAFNMERELLRVVYTLSRSYQRGIDGFDYEIVILDNGSTPPVDATALQKIAPNLQVLRVQNPHPSPICAINTAVEAIDCSILGLWIDGARMASPGMLFWALQALKLNPNKVVGTVAFHLGPDVQMRSVLDGYNQEVEDRLLNTIDWRNDGYKLFEVSVLAGSSIQGWFGSITESNAVFMERVLWTFLATGRGSRQSGILAPLRRDLGLRPLDHSWGGHISPGARRRSNERIRPRLLADVCRIQDNFRH
jgi:glycosyltransferase involved in cell wall biosynthesis